MPQNILICLLIIFQLTARVEENKSSGIWWEERMHLVMKKGSTYVCGRHFISEDYILGCSDNCLNPGGCSQSQKWKSVYEQSNKWRSLLSLASQHSLIKPLVCDAPKYLLEASSSHNHLSITFYATKCVKIWKIPCTIILTKDICCSKASKWQFFFPQVSQ